MVIQRVQPSPRSLLMHPSRGGEEGGRSREDSDATVFQWWSGCYQHCRGVADHLEREPIISPDMDGLNGLNRWMDSRGCRSGIEQWMSAVASWTNDGKIAIKRSSQTQASPKHPPN